MYTRVNNQEYIKIMNQPVGESGQHISKMISCIAARLSTPDGLSIFKLFNMIDWNKNMRRNQKIKMLIDFNFDFDKLFNMYDNVKHNSGLLLTCKH